MINYKLKSKILKDKVNFETYIYNRKVINAYIYGFKINGSYVSNEFYRKILESNYILRTKYKDEFAEYERIYHANIQRVKRLKNRISLLLQKPCLFLTLTWSPKYYGQSSKTKRQNVKEFLCSFQVPYIANSDWGDDHLYIDKKGIERQAQSREHYHAILQIDKIDYKKWRYGALNGKKVRLNETITQDGEIIEFSNKRLAKYISKLTNHAIKDSCKGSRIMYSRL